MLLRFKLLVSCRDVGSISNAGGARLFNGTVWENGVFFKNKKGTSLFIAKSWGLLALSATPFLRLLCLVKF